LATAFWFFCAGPAFAATIDVQPHGISTFVSTNGTVTPGGYATIPGGGTWGGAFGGYDIFVQCDGPISVTSQGTGGVGFAQVTYNSTVYQLTTVGSFASGACEWGRFYFVQTGAGGFPGLTGYGTSTITWQPSNPTTINGHAFSLTRHSRYCVHMYDTAATSTDNCTPDFIGTVYTAPSPLILYPANGLNTSYAAVNNASFNVLSITGTPTSVGVSHTVINNIGLTYSCSMTETVTTSLVDGSHTGTLASPAFHSCATIPPGKYILNYDFTPTGGSTQWAPQVTFTVSAGSTFDSVDVPSSCSGAGFVTEALCFIGDNAKYVVIPTPGSMEYLQGSLNGFKASPFFAELNTAAAVDLGTTVYCPLPTVTMPAMGSGIAMPTFNFCNEITTVATTFRGEPHYNDSVTAAFGVLGLLVYVAIFKMLVGA